LSPSEFEELSGSGTTDYIASVYNNLLHLHPQPVSALDGSPTAIKMVYRKVPRPYTTTAGVIQVGARINLQQAFDSRHTFLCYDYDTGLEAGFGNWGLNVDMIPGGYAYIGAPWMTSDAIGPLYICRIVMAWEANIGTEGAPEYVGMIRVSSDDSIPIHDEDSVNGIGYTFPYCYVTERQVFGNSVNAVEAEDWEFPEIGVAWHNMICEYAVSRIESAWNPQGAKYREDRIFQALSAAGASLDAYKGT
jgi:hypothetical protein